MFSVRREPSGFTLIEMLVTMSLIALLAAVAVPVSVGMVNRQRADSAAVSALMTIRAARDRAIAERRNVQLTFVPPNRITIERHELPGPATTVVEEVELTEDLEFRLFVAVPDTPDQFGNDEAIAFTGPQPVMFASDGSFVDANGDVVNGTIFMGREYDVISARAITIFGVTGHAQSWKWGGSTWMQ